MSRRAKVLLCIVLFVVVAVNVAGFVVGNFFYNLALNPYADRTTVFEASHNTMDFQETERTQAQLDRAWVDDSGFLEERITSFDGLLLFGRVFLNQNTAGNWVVICHGYNSAGRQMSTGVRQFYEQWGYNVLLPDARGCGNSEGGYMGMGWHDRLDMVDWIDWINERYGAANIILFGVSMGGATVMMTSGEALPENVRAVVEDCGYTSAKDEFAYQLKALFGLPGFPLMDYSSAVTRLRAGYWLGEASAVNQVAQSVTPTLFIHGSKDTFVPADMVYELYDACSAEKELYVVEGADHGRASMVAGDEYWQRVESFIGRYLV